MLREMLPSDINYLANSFKEIAEGKKKKDDDSYLETDMEKRRKNNEKAVEDMKKVKDDTVPRWMRENIARESFYYKRLEALNPVMAERYLAIAGFLIGEGYESPRLLDNIIEILPKDVVGHDFRAAISTVNPRLNENFETAEKRQARAIIREMDLGKKWKQFTNWLAPPKGSAAAADPKVRQGLEYTGPGGSAVRPNNSRAGREASAANAPAAPAAAPAAPRPRRGQGGRPLGDTTQRGGAAPAAAPAAPVRPATGGGAARPTAPAAAPKPFVKQTGNKAADMATWAKANPSLASKVTAAGTQKGTGQSTMAKQAAELRAMRPATPTPTNTSSATSLKGAGDAAIKGLSGKGALKTKLNMGDDTSLYDAIFDYLSENNLVSNVSEAHEVMKALTAEEIMYIVDEYTTKHGKKAMDWNRSDDKPKTVAKNPKMPKKKEGKCDCCGNDPCTCS